MDRHETPLPEPVHPVIDETHRRRSLFFLGLAVGCVGFTMAIQMGLNANFLAEELHMEGLEVGVLDAFRESCGIYAIGILAVLAGLAEPLTGAAMLMLVAGGIAAYSVVPSFAWIIPLSMIWSTGLHVWMPLPHSMTLALAEPGRSGHRMGQIRAADAAGFGTGLLAALLLTWLGLAMRPMYLLAGGLAVLAAAMCLGIPRRIKTPGPRFVFRRKYALYYVLSFLEGWRKQIFVCFAGFLLVKIHSVPLEHILWLHVAVQAIKYPASPWVGRLIDRIGERKVLCFYFACLTCFFVGYALIDNVGVLYAIFIIDNAFFVFAMGLETYVGRIAPNNELTPTLSMGVAMNHIAAVVMPIVGGILWLVLGHQWPFLAGAFAALLSIPVTLCIPRHRLPDASNPEA